MRSNEQLVDQLRAAPDPWADTAIVVVFENRFEFVTEDHPDPLSRLDSLLRDGGLPIGLAGVMPADLTHAGVLRTQVFEEYKGQEWAHRHMARLRGIVRDHEDE